ncbi:hypothetical protein HY450_02140 [Candidatus Pacearchaeota archaeon]|nr:hypothetical protein [Candidatus Pacearchaeota archaeon]
MIAELIVLLLAFPLGYLISWMTKEELVSGRKWFKVLIILSVAVGGWFALLGNFVVTLTSGFVLIVSLVSLMESYFIVK